LLTDSDLQSGSGVKSDLTDSDMFLRKSKQDIQYRIFKRSKSRHCEETDGAKLIRLNPETLWFEFVQDNIDEAQHIGTEVMPVKEEQKDLARELRDQGKTIEQIAKILNRGKGTIHRWLNE
jgi:DNA-binding NarL/FixJ family response regulator